MYPSGRIWVQCWWVGAAGRLLLTSRHWPLQRSHPDNSDPKQMTTPERMMSDENNVTGVPRRPSPMGGRRPTREDLERFATDDPDAIDDILPADGRRLDMLIVGVNPGLWTAAVNAPFARPGNRFWPSLHRAGLTDHRVDAAAGLSPQDEAQLLNRGIGLTNLVGRATVRADELTRDELRTGGERLTQRVVRLRPFVVAIAGITAFRVAFSQPKARLGEQDVSVIPEWPLEVKLWVIPQPSGLNAHANIDTLAEHWRAVWQTRRSS
ncbi:mismatch-specific DNA-glycosylase [Brooklawnia sp.]|uniref:mismatch-specific DNA-glycosylase n=1 Tax=Brooklawnia sp. TaxID=2699740 RepID=UPI00311EF5C7